MTGATVHASAVLVGAGVVLIRGPSGSGKSRLALGLLQAADAGLVRFARLVADDRCHVEAVHGRLLASPPEALAGLIEVRGLGVLRLPFEPVAPVRLVVDLDASDAKRLPEEADALVELSGIAVPRLAVAVGADPLPIVLAALANFSVLR